MATLYLIEQNTIIRKTGDRLLICKKPPARKTTTTHVTQEEIILEIPCADIDQVMIFGNIGVTTPALHKLLKHDIELAFFSLSGTLLGQLTPPKQKNIILRIAQFEQYHRQQFCLNFSKEIVKSKLNIALTNIKNHLANHPGLFQTEEIKKFNDFIVNAGKASELDELRGYEGSGSAYYFKLFGRMLKPPWMFDTRTKRPPLDPVNAVLSYGYVIVTAELQSLLDGIGFDPYLGFYHQIKYGRPSLALDLVEEFRHCLIDRLSLTLFNTGVFTEQDFFNPPKGGVYLSLSGKKKFFKQFEKMLGQFDSATIHDEKMGYRKHFQEQVAALVKTVQHDVPYKSLEL